MARIVIPLVIRSDSVARTRDGFLEDHEMPQENGQDKYTLKQWVSIEAEAWFNGEVERGLQKKLKRETQYEKVTE